MIYESHLRATEENAWPLDTTIAWDAIDLDVAHNERELHQALHDAALIEGYLPVYAARLIQLLWDDVDATAVLSMELFEGLKHFTALARYLDRVGYQREDVSEATLVAARERALGLRYDQADLIAHLTNFMCSELFAAYFFLRMSRRTNEPVLKDLLGYMARDEFRHSASAGDVLKKRIDRDPAVVPLVLAAAEHFRHYGSDVVDVPVAEENDFEAIMAVNRKIRLLCGLAPTEHLKESIPVEISENDLWILSYYRESELAGGLIMGRLARETDDDDLRVHLTEHCAEEAMHAWLWTETILKVGGVPKRVAETYQARYYAEIGMPASLLEILTLTQVFERRVIRHFRAHLKWPNVHPAVVDTLNRMIRDEVGHISWVKDRLDRYAAERGDAIVAETMRRFTEVDERVYEAAMRYRDNARELLDATRQTVAGPRSTDVPPARAADSTNAEVRRLVAKSLAVPDESVHDTSSLRDLGVNSLDLVVLVMAIEERFHIEFDPSDLERLRTFADLARRVTELVAAR